MKWFVGNLFSCLSILGMFLFSILLGCMIVWSGIDFVRELSTGNYLIAAWEAVSVLIFSYWSVVWVRSGVDWWIETDHKIQRKLLGKVY